MIDWNNITVLDFETVFSKEYSLRRMTTEAYVRDPRFGVHCVAVWTAQKGYEIVSPDNLASYVTGRTVIAQKAQFDGLILSHYLDLRPAMWVCTLSMARAMLPHLKSHSLESLAEYYALPTKTIDYGAFVDREELDPETQKMLEDGCMHDVQLTKEIAKRLLKDFPESELDVVDLTIRLFTEPSITLDVDMAQAELERIRLAKRQAIASLGVTREDLQSSARFSELLTACGAEIPTKYSAKQKKPIPALAKGDPGMKALLASEDARVSALAAARLGEKSTLMETRLERLINMQTRCGSLCLYLNYAGATNTLRWSGGDKLNPQNFPPAIQRALVAPKGYKFVKTDSAQIECRLLNYFAGQEDVTEAFRSGKDVYAEGATKHYKRQITKADKVERFLFKVLELSAGFGAGWKKVKVAFALGAMGGDPVFLTDKEAQDMISSYRALHPKVTELWYKYDAWLDKMYALPPEQRRINLPNGMFLDWSALRKQDGDYYRGDQKVYGALVVENIIQALGRVFLAEVMVRIHKLYPEYKLVLCTHDDLVHLVPEDDILARDRIAEQFKVPPSWAPELPLSSDSYVGERYSK